MDNLDVQTSSEGTPSPEEITQLALIVSESCQNLHHLQSDFLVGGRVLLNSRRAGLTAREMGDIFELSNIHRSGVKEFIAARRHGAILKTGETREGQPVWILNANFEF